VFGLLLGGLAVGSVLLVLGALIPVAWLRVSAAVVVFLLAVVADTRLGRERTWLPSAHRQIPQEIAFRGPSGALQFGLAMGTGARTYSTTHLPHVAAAWTVAIEPFGTSSALVAGFAFACGRALSYVLVVGWQSAVSVERRQATMSDAARLLVAPTYLLWCVTIAAWAVQ